MYEKIESTSGITCLQGSNLAATGSKSSPMIASNMSILVSKLDDQYKTGFINHVIMSLISSGGWEEHSNLMPIASNVTISSEFFTVPENECEAFSVL